MTPIPINQFLHTVGKQLVKSEAKVMSLQFTIRDQVHHS